MVQVSRLVQAVSLSWLHPWVDHGKQFIVAPPSAQVWLHHCMYINLVIFMDKKAHKIHKNLNPMNITTNHKVITSKQGTNYV